MSAFVVSLREPRFGNPVAAEVLGDITVAAVASAWGSWSGLEAEVPAVVGARTSLVADARAGETDWRAALLRAFAVAAVHIDRVPQQEEDDEWTPLTSMTCAVVTPERIHIGWLGGVTACVLDDRRLVRETEPHTLIRQLLAEGNKTAALAGMAHSLGHIIVRSVGPASRGAPSPEFAEWPPLRPGERLLLAPRPTVAALRGHLPLAPAGGDPWLQAAVSTCDDAGHRIGVLVEP
ncbi:PP2C family serine/threonine-protein phosphatase [Nannocystis punicea]|uniref:PP2C family serine/threonine-protein phosphatase n=1 Tax=Nannocystis punicea TaxID=2995304 RepID=A0ABY7H815_9BACT|nr:PP2C family serine/threonine-protein phosphatase [Nannocystis poenicansa]WAS95413.1 PP2C family serine/threonine-protein phosphatase [Nannocystis poenicansa]